MAKTARNSKAATKKEEKEGRVDKTNEKLIKDKQINQGMQFLSEWFFKSFPKKMFFRKRQDVQRRGMIAEWCWQRKRQKNMCW